MLGILEAVVKSLAIRPARVCVVGELALDGMTRPTKGVLSMAMAAAKQPGVRGILVPTANAAEGRRGGIDRGLPDREV